MTKITVKAIVHAPIDKVWTFWNEPQHVKHWNFASPDWHSPSGQNDLRTGGKFSFRMEAKDGSAGFDFGGTYELVKKHELIVYRMGDGRRVHVSFKAQGNETEIVETFDSEPTHTLEQQQSGWQSILNNFKKYAESKK
ncbi:MAG TPA: SRPBCC family protein [Candidatus Binatia bacterium]|nr:SRPBCC family protein [Candidatus Binatia bacterium]